MFDVLALYSSRFAMEVDLQSWKELNLDQHATSYDNHANTHPNNSMFHRTSTQTQLPTTTILLQQVQFISVHFGKQPLPQAQETQSAFIAAAVIVCLLQLADFTNVAAKTKLGLASCSCMSPRRLRWR